MVGTPAGVVFDGRPLPPSPLMSRRDYHTTAQTGRGEATARLTSRMWQRTAAGKPLMLAHKIHCRGGHKLVQLARSLTISTCSHFQIGGPRDGKNSATPALCLELSR